AFDRFREDGAGRSTRSERMRCSEAFSLLLLIQISTLGGCAPDSEATNPMTTGGGGSGGSMSPLGSGGFIDASSGGTTTNLGSGGVITGPETGGAPNPTGSGGSVSGEGLTAVE